MAKPPPIEFFEVTVKCPKEILGDLMSDINKRGLAEVKFDLVTTVAAFKANRHAPVNGVPSTEFLAGWIRDHATFRAKDAVEAFKVDGRTASATYPALHTLVEKGILKKLGPGEYSRADVKALPKPAKAKKVKAAKGVSTRHKFEIKNNDFALRVMSRNHGKITSSTLKGHFEKDGRAPTGVGPTLRGLIDDRRIKSLGDGLYELVKKAEPKKTEPKANGHAPEVTPAPGV